MHKQSIPGHFLSFHTAWERGYTKSIYIHLSQITLHCLKSGDHTAFEVVMCVDGGFLQCFPGVLVEVAGSPEEGEDSPINCWYMINTEELLEQFLVC